MHDLTDSADGDHQGEGSPAAACSENYRPVQENGDAEFHPLRMTWVVVSDPNGNRHFGCTGGLTDRNDQHPWLFDSASAAPRSAMWSSSYLSQRTTTPDCLIFVFGTSALYAQTADSQETKDANKSWTATTDFKRSDVNPPRIIESHTQNGNRTLDKRMFQFRGFDGNFETFEELETENPASRRSYRAYHNTNLRSTWRG
jgi:hypothetical protein